MPGFDGTGPQGAGPMTGRGRGYCMSYLNPAAGPVSWFGWGSGRGRRRWYSAAGLPWWARCLLGAAPAAVPALWRAFYPAGSRQEEYDALKEQVKCLEDALEHARKRIKELEEKEKE